jgi:glycosyltransferase involved in cell wall biosynthesis
VKPLLFATGHAPAYRVGALARLHEREGIELALFGGRSKHAGADFDGELPFPHRRVSQPRLERLAASGRYRAVVCPTGGRVAPLALWMGARRSGTPLLLWASLWAHPRTLAHALGYVPLLGLYRAADAVVTYGPHVSAYVGARGAGNVYVAPQSVDDEFWSAAEVEPPSDPRWPSATACTFVFVGRPDPEKGLGVLLDAWRASGLTAPRAALVLVGGADIPRRHGSAAAPLAPDGVLALDRLAPRELRDVYAAADVLVVPSIPTRTFLEPWGLVVNEAMSRGLPVIASDAVGAAAGGLVRDGENGLVVPAGDSGALARALARLSGDGALRARMGAAGAAAVRAYSHEAWAEGFSRALASLGLSASPALPPAGVGSVG